MRFLFDLYYIYLQFFIMLDLCSDLKKKWNILKDFGLFFDSGFIDVYIIIQFFVQCLKMYINLKIVSKLDI